MFYYPPNNQYINEGMPFTIDGVDYPANWLNLSTPEQKEELGLEEVIVTNSPANQTYYWVSEELSGATLTYINTPKDLDQCKALAVSQTNSTAYSLLFPSDWMVVRNQETGWPVPEDWTTYRAAVRSTADQAKIDIAAAVDVDALAALVIDWPVSPDVPVIAPDIEA